ncbi:MAG: MmcB family DNA repair protein [Pseudomonadota bacterium]
MPIIDPVESDPFTDGRQSDNAMRIRRGLERHFAHHECVFLPELALKTGRRADLIAMDRKGLFTIVEIKSSIEDFRADNKWPDYLAFCDRYYFATHPGVPQDIFPAEEGLIIADQYGAEIVRECVERKLPAASRKALTLRFARASAQRLAQLTRFAEKQGLTPTFERGD